jgi:phosphoribosylanthranilate isomerase
VQQLLTRYRPDGVDVSSGVEKNGVKSAERMQQFVQRVRAI